MGLMKTLIICHIVRVKILNLSDNQNFYGEI